MKTGGLVTDEQAEQPEKRQAADKEGFRKASGEGRAMRDRSGGRKAGDVRQCSRCPESFVLTAAQAKWGETRCKACRGADDHRDEITAVHGTSYGYSQGCRCDSCRAANRDKMRQYRETHRESESRRSAIRRARPHYRSQLAVWKATNAIKQKARSAVMDALRAGRLARPERCGCGSNVRIEAHHADYSKPLDVEWLCRRCHWKHHETPRKAA